MMASWPRRVILWIALGSTALSGAACGGSSDSSLFGEGAGADAMEETPRADDAGTADGEGGQLRVDGEPLPVRPIVEIPDDYPSAVEAVYGRYWLYWEAFAAAYGPPAADPTYAPLRELSTERNWESLSEQLQDFADDGLILVLPEPSETQHMIRIPNASVLGEEEGAEVILQDCWIDDFIQQTVDGRVLVEQNETKLMNVSMRLVDGEWRVDGVSRATAESDGYEQCQTTAS